jgi:predicted  nucleic acid-binding Zn-ribbon protein
MAYKCVNCSKVYEDGSNQILTGCDSCQGKFFFYINAKKLKEIEEKKVEEPDLTTSEKKQIEKDLREIAGIEDDDKPVFLEFESVKIMKPGKYLLDLTKLFDRDKPQIYQLEKGRYVVDFATKNREAE